MARYDVITYYSETVYGKAYKVVEADSEEEAIEIAFADMEDWHYKEKGSCEMDMDSEEAEAWRV